jgi:hypothetical protein
MFSFAKMFEPTVQKIIKFFLIENNLLTFGQQFCLVSL